MDVTGDPVALIYNKPGDEGSAYTLRLPSGKEVVIGDAEDDYWTLANIIDKRFPTGFVDRFHDQLRSFDIIVTRSAGDDQAVLVMIDGTFDEDGQPPLRVLVNDEPVFSQADFSGDANDEGFDAGSTSFTIQPHQIGYGVPMAEWLGHRLTR